MDADLSHHVHVIDYRFAISDKNYSQNLSNNSSNAIKTRIVIQLLEQDIKVQEQEELEKMELVAGIFSES